MSTTHSPVRKTNDRVIDDQLGVADVDLARALFDLAIHDAAEWLDAERRLSRARTHRLAVLEKLVADKPLTGAAEDDLWFSATVLGEVLRDSLGLPPGDVSTAFDVIGLPGAGAVQRSERAARVSRRRLEHAVRVAIGDRDLEPLDDSEDESGSLSGDSLEATDSSDDLAVAA